MAFKGRGAAGLGENARHLELKDELNQLWMSAVSAATCLQAIFFQFDANSPLDGLENQLIRFWGSKVTVALHVVNTFRAFWGEYSISP